MVITDCSIKNGVKGVSINSLKTVKRINCVTDEYGLIGDSFNCLSYNFLTSLYSNNIVVSEHITNRSVIE